MSNAEPIERRYALIRVEPGVYLLPSNDARTLWRISAYTEDGSGAWERPDGTLRTIRGRYWQTARRPFPSEAEIETLDLWDDRWDFYSHLCPTRRAAIEDALGAGRK